MTPVDEEKILVTVGQMASGSVFRARLNELFADAGPNLTNAAVLRGLLDHGCRIAKRTSPSYFTGTA